jgi:hypothetical protein
MSNFVINCDWANLATVESTSNEYLTFNFSSSVVVKEWQTKRCSVKADVTAWPSDTIVLDINNVLDIRAVSTKYWYWAKVYKTFTANTLTIQAWELAISKIEPAYDKFRDDKENIELWWFKLTPKSWQDLEFDKFSAKLTIANNSNNVIDTTSFVLQDVTSWATYDLTYSSTNNVAYYDWDLWISINDWAVKTFKVLMDTNDVTTNTWTIKLDLENIWTDNTSTNKCSQYASRSVICIKETSDDKYVTDITPSALSYKTLTW